jgi:hypothetical protein
MMYSLNLLQFLLNPFRILPDPINFLSTDEGLPPAYIISGLMRVHVVMGDLVDIEFGDITAFVDVSLLVGVVEQVLVLVVIVVLVVVAVGLLEGVDLD